MKKRSIKYIKLIAGSLAVASIFSACATNTRTSRRNRRDRDRDNTPETVYVYVTATPTPTPIEETTSTGDSLVPTLPSSTTPSVPENNDDEPVWTEDGAYLFSIFDDNSDTNTTETTNENSWMLEGENEESILNIINGFRRVDEIINDFNYREARDNAVNEARELIDFIFYGAEMNGTTFAELTDAARLAFYERLQALDARIMEYYPDYKTDLGELYNRVRDFLSTAYENAREAFGSHISINVEINPTETTMNTQRESKQLILKKD